MATKLTNTHKLAIQQGLKDNKSVSQIAKEIKVPLSALNHYLETLFESMSRVSEINKQKEKDKPKTVKDLMVTKTTEGKKRGVAIMTREASERVDAANEKLQADGGKAFRERYQDCMHNIRASDEE